MVGRLFGEDGLDVWHWVHLFEFAMNEKCRLEVRKGKDDTLASYQRV